MKVYAVICSRDGMVAPSFQLFRVKRKAVKEACRLVRELREVGRTFATGSLHKSGMCHLHYGGRNGYHIADSVVVEERESRDYPDYVVQS